MKIVALSDQHGTLPDVPACDLLLIAGDICPATDHRTHVQADWLDWQFRRWLRSLAHCKHVVGVAGNHDFVFQEKPHLVPKDLPWTYLQDSGCEVEGLKVWGTPWQPVFHDWAFNGTPEVLKEKWALMPEGTDVLVVHGPPRGYGDLVARRHITEDNEHEWPAGEHTGCPHLLERITQVRPKLVVYGHIHESYGRWQVNGTTLANVSILDEHYRQTRAASVFEVTP